MTSPMLGGHMNQTRAIRVLPETSQLENWGRVRKISFPTRKQTVKMVAYSLPNSLVKWQSWSRRIKLEDKLNHERVTLQVSLESLVSVFPDLGADWVCVGLLWETDDLTLSVHGAGHGSYYIPNKWVLIISRLHSTVILRHGYHWPYFANDETEARRKCERVWAYAWVCVGTRVRARVNMYEWVCERMCVSMKGVIWLEK